MFVDTRSDGMALPEIPVELQQPFLTALFRDLPIGIVLFDLEGHFLYVNDATAALNGVPAREHTGRHIREVVPDLWEAAEPILLRVREGEAVQWEISGETPASPGVTRQWAEQWFPVRDESGAVIAVAGTILEVTEQKRAEESLQQTSEMRQRLFHLAAHELRGPLTSITGFAQRLERSDALDHDGRAAVEIILDQAREMRHRLDLFLSLADAGTMPVDGADAERVDPAALVREEWLALEAAYPSARLVLRCPQPVELSTHRHVLREILSTLLDNAAKYGSEAGPIEVTIDQSQHTTSVAVRDHGPGIPEDLRARVFDPGFRAPAARNSTIPGQGFGLFIASQLAAHIGASVEVASAAGSGTTLLLRLPNMPSGDEAAADGA